MSFAVDDFRDLLRLLEERPDWRAELRRVVLTEDLLRLPEELARARQETELRFQELAARVAVLAGQLGALVTRIDALTTEVSALTSRVDALTTQVSTLAGHVGSLRGESLEQRYRTRAFPYFSRLLRRAHVLTSEELTTLLEDAIQARTLSVEDAHEIGLADVVVRGKRQTDGSAVYLIVEVSVGVGLEDVQRARRRAALLAQVGVAALPVVAGERVVPEAGDAAQSLRVWQVTDGRVVGPEGASG